MEHCAHKRTANEQASADFECDACGLGPSSSFLVFRDSVIICQDCGLTVHEKCRSARLNPSLYLYAANRLLEKKASAQWKKSLLPELRAKHSALDQKIKGLQETLKRTRAKVDEELWSRSWTLRTFATKFYSEHNPEKNDPSQLNPLIAYYSRTPSRCRLFFERLATAYPDHKVGILVQATNIEDSLKHDEISIQELEMLEGSFEQMSDLRDELQREILFPLNPAFGVAPKWRLRLSFEGITLAMGDFNLEHLRARLKVSAGVIDVGEERVPSVKVELLGLQPSNHARFSASVSKLGLSGPMMPVVFFADALFLSFDCRFQLRVDFVPAPLERDGKKRRGKWKVIAEATKCEVTNLRQLIEGSTIPLPSTVLDLVLSSLFTFGMKKGVLAVLPPELGEYISKLNRDVCDFEWKLRIESLYSNDVRGNMPVAELPTLERIGANEQEMAALLEVMKRTTPRPSESTSEIWSVTKLLSTFRRFIKDSINKPKWLALWHNALVEAGLDGIVIAERLWDIIGRLDSKPCTVEIDCLYFHVFVAVRELARVVRGIMMRAVSTKSTTAVEVRADLKRNASFGAISTAAPLTPRASAEQARTAISEVVASFELAVESALSHALRKLNLGFELLVTGGLLSINIKRVKMVSRLGEQFEAPIPAKWLGEKILQSAKPGWPWKTSFHVDASSGALRFAFSRSEEFDLIKTQSKFDDLTVQVAEVEVKVAFSELVDALMKHQRRQLFGSSEDFLDKLDSSGSVAGSDAEDETSTFPGSVSDSIKQGRSHEAFVMMRVGYKGNVGAVARGLGTPRMETSLSHILLSGPLASLVRLLREFRLARSVGAVEFDPAAAIDGMDGLLKTAETKVLFGGPDQKLLVSLLLELNAEATEDADLHVELSVPKSDSRTAFTFVDDIELVTLASELGIIQL